MAFAKRKGILATPGKYRYGEITEEKTAEELKSAVDRQPTIMLTMGHPTSGFPSATDFIGTVTQKWDAENHRVLGDFWFYEESKSKIPQKVLHKIVNNEPVPISAGFAVDEVVDGIQKGLVYTHVAILGEENPACPLDQCGINVRQESSDLPNIRLEEQRELKEADAEESIEEVEDEISEPEGLTVDELQSEIEELKQQLTEIQNKDQTSAVQEPELEESEESQEQEDLQEPEPEPKRVIPSGTPRTKHNFTVEDGIITWVSPAKEKNE